MIIAKTEIIYVANDYGYANYANDDINSNTINDNDNASDANGNASANGTYTQAPHRCKWYIQCKVPHLSRPFNGRIIETLE